MAAYKKAGTRSETMVASILKLGLEEQRAAEALAAVRPWLFANTAKSQALFVYAGRAMQYAGDWPDAVMFYRRLLKSKPLDAKLAAIVVPETYQLMINDMRDTNAAYLFMREDGNRLRTYGRAKQFDHWFLREAVERGDWLAVAERLTTIYGDATSEVSDYDEFLNTLLKELERFGKRNADTVAALDKLGATAITRRPDIKPRWDWIHAATVVNAKVIEAVENKQEIPAEWFDEAVKAGRALVTHDPQSARLVVRAWVQWGQGNRDKFWAFVHAQSGLKAELLMLALNRLSPDAAAELLRYRCDSPIYYHRRAKRRHTVALTHFLSAEQRLAMARRCAEHVNHINGLDLVRFDAKMSLADARAVAPILEKNPHKDAALIRAYAAAGKATVVDMIPHMMKRERWRFNDARDVVDTVWNCGADQKEADHGALVKKYESQGAGYNQLKKQVGKQANSQQRLAALNALYRELMGTPSTPAVLELWKELVKDAPIPDKIQMVKWLVSEYVSASGTDREQRKRVLSRALWDMEFGESRARIGLGPGFHDLHHESCRRNLPALANHLLALLRQQQQKGKVDGPVFGLWLHSVKTDQKEAQALIKEFARSQDFAGLGDGYREMAAYAFGDIARPDGWNTDPSRQISRELLKLAKDAKPAQVEAALQAVLTRVNKAPEPITVIGLHQVAALPTIKGTTRSFVLTLFNQFSPLGEYPHSTGYEQLGLRVVKDMQKAKRWGELVPYAASLWRASRSPDPARYGPRPVRNALMSYTEAALKDGQPAVAFSLAQIGLRAKAVGGAERDRMNDVVAQASKAMGIVEIAGDETDPTYAILKADAEYRLGNVKTAWKLYVDNEHLLMPAEDGSTSRCRSLMRKLSLDYLFWLIRRDIAEDRLKQAEHLVKEVTIWSREDEGLLSITQQGDLQIAYADLAFRNGKLPTARAWYRKVADARAHSGTEAQLRAGLGSAKVDRVSRNFDAALGELDRLLRIKIPGARTRVRYARAEVLMDQENFKEAFDEVEAVLLRDPNHEDARILRGEIEIQMRRLVEATEIELGISREDSVIVPGEVLKINLVDPMLNVAGLGADIEVEVWAKSGDRERVMLHPLGDDRTKYRANVPTALAPAVPGDKVLQVLGEDEIRYGYAKRFRAKLKDLPPDRKTAITIAADAEVAFSAGAFPPKQGERRLTIEELGLSSAQARLGSRMVRPGNPVYLRITDADRSKTAGIDQITVSIASSSGDVIRRLLVKETGPFTGVFEAVVPTAAAQARALASESAPGRDPNMSISPKDHPGWLGEIGRTSSERTFTVDLNDNVPLDKMTFNWMAPDKKITHLVLQTSLDGNRWVDRGYYPQEETPWDGRPRITSTQFVITSRGRHVPAQWRQHLQRASVQHNGDTRTYQAHYVGSLSTLRNPRIAGVQQRKGHRLMRYQALFHQKVRAERRFRLKGYPANDTVFLIDGSPAPGGKDSDPLLIERELGPGLHSVEVWTFGGRWGLGGKEPVLLCDVPGSETLKPCADSMFDPKTFPKDLLAAFVDDTQLTYKNTGLDVVFDRQTEARMIRLRIYGFQGTAPGLGKVTLTGRDGETYLPVAYDFMELSKNDQIEVLPGDTITARYEDPVSATPGRNRHEKHLGVAFNNARVSASFLNYQTTRQGRTLKLEQVRRFNLEDAVAIVIDDVDMDIGPKRDVVAFTALTSDGRRTTLKAVETEPNSGMFIGRIFPVTAKPKRASELQVPEGGSLTLIYRDEENLDPGIPTDRSVTIDHALYRTPKLGVYTASSKPLPPKDGVFQRSLAHNYVEEAKLGTTPLRAVIRSTVRFDVVAPHLALAQSSTLAAYVQTEAGRRLASKSGKQPTQPYDITVPGTKKLTGKLIGGNAVIPPGYINDRGRGPATQGNPLDEGRFVFSVPLVLGDLPKESFATQTATERAVAEESRGLAVQEGDVVHIGYAWKDEQDLVQWKTASVQVGSDGFMSVMTPTGGEALEGVFVGEKALVRVEARGLGQGPRRDFATVQLQAKSGAKADFRLSETGRHSGIFTGVFTLRYADKELPEKLPPVRLNGFPVLYGDEVTVTYAAEGGEQAQVYRFAINTGANGKIEPFTKRFTGDEMAVRTSFTLSECFFELAKQHSKMDQESLARRELAHAKKLLQEALATHHDDELRAHAEYLLGNLAQEYADLAKNDESKQPMYKEALSRFSKIPVDYPETEFAHKAQFKTGLVYEKLGESAISVEEYAKLAYKYPESEHIPEAMSRLGRYFQKTGQAYKDQADELRDKTDVESVGEVVRLDRLATPEFLKAATIYGKLQERFPENKLAGLAGLASAMNAMRAHEYKEAIVGFSRVVDNEDYDDLTIRSQALYWQGLCHERIIGMMGNVATLTREAALRRNYTREAALKIYYRLTFDFPDSKWAKYARGRLADPGLLGEK